MSEMKKYLLAVTCVPSNYQTAPPVEQCRVNFETLRASLEDVFWVENYNLELQIPDFYLDLKATSILRRASESGLTDHLKALDTCLITDSNNAGGVFTSKQAVELNATLNSHHHCPAIFLLIISGKPSDFLQWNNERIGDGFKFGNNKSNPFAATFPQSCVNQLQEVFSNEIKFQTEFFLNPISTQSYARMLRDEIREQMSEKDQIKFDREIEKVRMKNERSEQRA